MTTSLKMQFQHLLYVTWTSFFPTVRQNAGLQSLVVGILARVAMSEEAQYLTCLYRVQLFCINLTNANERVRKSWPLTILYKSSFLIPTFTVLTHRWRICTPKCMGPDLGPGKDFRGDTNLEVREVNRVTLFYFRTCHALYVCKSGRAQRNKCGAMPPNAALVPTLHGSLRLTWTRIWVAAK